MMNIVVECACRATYEFEIEPVAGQMPAPVSCPTCGADGTAAANQFIRTALEQAAAARPKLTLKRPTPAAPPPPAPADDPGLPKFCFFHPSEAMDGFCLSCKKPICRRCMKQSGYFCSALCRGRAEALGMEIPEYAGQDRLAKVRDYERLTRLTVAGGVALVLLFGVYEWYQIWGKKPSVQFTIPLPATDSHTHAKFISDREILITSPAQVTLYDSKNRREVWTQSLATYRPTLPPLPETIDAELPPADQLKLAKLLEAYADLDSPRVSAQVVGDCVWITTSRTIIGFDRATGAERLKTTIPGHIRDVTVQPDSLLVISTEGFTDQIFTRVELPAGQQQTVTRSNQPPAQADDSESPAPFSPHTYQIAGATIAAVTTRLLEQRLVTVETMKPANPDAISKDLNVTQLREVAEDVFNEMKRARTGGTTTVDESRYAVTLQRIFGPTAAPWTGEVTGPPHFFALATVDVLVAGRHIHVFDRANRKLWESQLSYPIAASRRADSSWEFADMGDPAPAPCVERGDTLYVFDRGVLTAFAIKTGTVHWRLPSVGISQIAFDDAGLLYVTTTSAGPESIQYTDQVNFRNPAEPVIEKVAPATGKILWRLPKFGDECHLAGKHVLITKSRGGALLMATPSSSFFLSRLNPKTGQQLWEYNTLDAPRAVDFHDNRILVQYPDRLDVLKFLPF